MPEPQTDRNQEQRQQRRDPFKGFEIPIPGISGLNTTLPPNAIQDHEGVAIFNFLPVAKNTLRKIASPALDCALLTDAIKVVNDVLNGSPVKFAILNDGSCGIINSGIYTQVAGAGTFSTDPSFMDITNWRNQVFLIVDLNTGYWLYTPTAIAALAAPVAPTLGQASGGAITGTTYYVKITYTNYLGETTVSGESNESVSANYLLTVTSPSELSGASGWNVYVGTSTGTETKQNSSPIPIGVDWTMPTTGMASGSAMPSSNTTGSTAGLNQVDATIKGRAIAVWNGRVFIANGRNLTYSVALSCTNFSVIEGGGSFIVPHTDLKQEIMRLVPYMDSFYTIGDHGVIAFTGTTISNDPNNWYQMEIFNNAGTIYGNLLFNFNNTIYNVNEYGIWMAAATQDQFLSYKIDISQFTFNNFPGTICQIGTVNFYIMPIKQFSPFTFKLQDNLLAYCIELKEFYFLDFGFNVKGIYTTLSETDHSIYVWGNSGVYKLFAGTGEQACQIDTKTFDLGDEFLYKAVKYLLATYNVRAGNPKFTVTCNFQNPNQGYLNASASQSSSTYQRNLVFSNKNYQSFQIGLTNTYGKLILLGNSFQKYILNSVYSFGLIPNFGQGPFAAWNTVSGVGGTNFFFSIYEKSNAIFDVVNFTTKGFIGRKLVK